MANKKFKHDKIRLIPKNWKYVTLDEIAEFVRGFSYKGSEKNIDGQYVFVTLNNVKRGGGFKKDFSYITSDRIKEKHFVYEGSLVITNTDVTAGILLGYPALVEFPATYTKNKAVFSHHITKIILKSQINKNYLYYYLCHNQQNAKKYRTGSVVLALDIKNWSKNEKILLPPPKDQKAIAKILSDLDAKIELNHQMNKTLEQISQSIFKSWFIDYEFPNEKGLPYKSSGGELYYNVKIKKKIPKNWSVGQIYEISDVIFGAPFNSKLFNKEKKGLPLIRIRDLKNFNPEIYTDEKHPNATMISPGDIIAGMDAVFKPHIWLGEHGYLNQRLCYFRPKKTFHKYFILKTIEPLCRFFENAKDGTTVSHLGKADIDTWQVIIPNTTINNEFMLLIDNIFHKIIDNSQENITLRLLRDSLLPKLISGYEIK